MKFSGLLLALTISPFAFSGEIITNNYIQVLSLNGQDASDLSIVDNAVQTKDGIQQIVVRYSRSFRDETILQSRPFIFNIDVIGKTTITTDTMNSYSLAKRKISTGLDWHVENEETKYTIEDADELTGKGFLPYSDIGALVATYNTDHDLVVSNAPGTTSITKITTNDLIDMYKSASLEQKKQFKTWLIHNETK